MDLSLLDILLLFLIGCAGGFLAGLLGIGGGIIFVIVLNYIFSRYGISSTEVVKFTVGNSLFATFFAGISASVRQVRSRNFFLKEVLTTGLPGVVTSLLTTWTILAFDWYKAEYFMVFFLLLLALFMYKMFQKDQKPGESEEEAFNREISTGRYIMTGMVSGIISALSGLGGGIIIIPFLHNFFKLHIRKAASISLGIIPLFAVANSVVYSLSSQDSGVEMPWTFGYIALPVVLPMVAGVVIFAPVGVKLAHRLPQRKIRVAFGVLLLILMIRMAYENFVHYF